MTTLARMLATGLSLNRVACGVAYAVLPSRAGPGWIGRIARDPATHVFARGHGARDVALRGGALAALARHDGRSAREWMSAQALADSADPTAALLSRRQLPSGDARFALLLAGATTAVAAASALVLADAARADATPVPRSRPQAMSDPRVRTPRRSSARGPT
jgi:hypothetical protein